ncbi:MAG: NUDIX hydrolase [Bacteroidota bacterium]
MDEIKKEIFKTFGQQLRLRVCGICVLNEQVLLVKHQGLGRNGTLWAPPGGGVTFGESVPQALEREFREETGLEIAVGRFLFVNEFIGLPLHAVELFFEVRVLAGELKLGIDPEMLSHARKHQSIKEVRFLDFAEIKQKDEAEMHPLFRHCRHVQDLLALQGYFRQ